jgi:L-lactate dehydrogenase
MPERYDAAALRELAAGLLGAVGMDAPKAADVADVLVEGDLLGQTTHGLNLLAPYLDAVTSGRMAPRGEPVVVARGGAVETWDGMWLPGPYLVRAAWRVASRQASDGGLGAVAIRRGSHLGCLGAYLRPAAEAGFLAIIASSDPSGASVAPWGGTAPLYTPNPLAAGWPSPGGPVMIDVSMSITTNGMTARRRAEGQPFAHPVLMDATGRPTADPAVTAADPPGSLLPLGAPAAGHKGFALGLLVEALTSALAGHGRADAPTNWGASALILAIDPRRFGGGDAFLREAAWMEAAVHANPPFPGGEPPRLPGERALRRRAEQLAHGVELYPTIAPTLAARAAAAGLAMPRPL